MSEIAHFSSRIKSVVSLMLIVIAGLVMGWTGSHGVTRFLSSPSTLQQSPTATPGVGTIASSEDARARALALLGLTSDRPVGATLVGQVPMAAFDEFRGVSYDPANAPENEVVWVVGIRIPDAKLYEVIPPSLFGDYPPVPEGGSASYPDLNYYVSSSEESSKSIDGVYFAWTQGGEELGRGALVLESYPGAFPTFNQVSVLLGPP